MAEYQLAIGGMSCASCVSHVEKALKQLPEVDSVSVNLATERAYITSHQDIETQKLITAVEDEGYSASLLNHAQPVNLTTHHDIRLWQVLLAGALAMVLMWPMFAHLLGVHSNLLSVFGQWLLASVVQFYFGLRFYMGSFYALRRGVGNMDVLVALGTTAAYGLSLYLWSQGQTEHLYFEASSTVISLVLLGKYLERLTKRKTSAALDALQALYPDTAWRMDAFGQFHEVAIADVIVGDRLRIRAGERVAVDAVIEQGSSVLDESMLTGESAPVSKREQDRVHAGTINQDGLLVVRAIAKASGSRLAQIIAQVEAAQANKPPIQQLVDRISAVFVPTVVGLSMLTLLGWWLTGHPFEISLIHAVTVLVIACPCALGLATPAAMMAGIGVAARYGILIQDAASLEIAHRVQVVAFDKTGTLTKGQHELVEVLTAIDRQTALQLAASLQHSSPHPLGRAVIRAAQAQQLPTLTIEHGQTLAGLGVVGQITDQAQTHHYAFGNQRLLDRYDLTAPTSDQHPTATWSWLVDVDQRQILAAFAFVDTLKPDAAVAVDALQSKHIDSVMITGDQVATAQHVAKLAHIQTVHAGVLPAQKRELIQALQTPNAQQTQVVAMVGDGINDAPALAQADLSIAMNQGTDIAMHTAQMTLMHPRLMSVVDAIDISQQTWRKIQQNLFWAFAYNVVGIPLAMFGVLSPIWAALAMALSSVCVVSNALLLNRWTPSSMHQS